MHKCPLSWAYGLTEGPVRPDREGIYKTQIFYTPVRDTNVLHARKEICFRFDDPNLIGYSGLVPIMALVTLDVRRPQLPALGEDWPAVVGWRTGREVAGWRAATVRGSGHVSTRRDPTGRRMCGQAGRVGERLAYAGGRLSSWRRRWRRR